MSITVYLYVCYNVSYIYFFAILINFESANKRTLKKNSNNLKPYVLIAFGWLF